MHTTDKHTFIQIGRGATPFVKPVSSCQAFCMFATKLANHLTSSGVSGC